MYRIVLATFMLLIAGAASALAPEDGIWWNPAQSGRGWFVVTQNNLMIVSSYTYAQNGAPAWFLSVGTYNRSTRTYSATLDGYANGQCLGCAYRAPTQAGSAGALTIVFADERRATLIQAGETVPIEKMYFAYNEPNDRLYGEWAYAGNVGLGIGDAEFLVFDRTYTSPSDGKSYVQLRRKFSSVGIGLGRFYPESNEYLVLLDSSTSYYKTYSFKMENSRLAAGRWWLHLKTQLPTGAGSALFGSRIAERSDVGAKHGGVEGLHHAHDSALAAAMPFARSAVDGALEAEISELVRVFEARGFE